MVLQVASVRDEHVESSVCRSLGDVLIRVGHGLARRGEEKCVALGRVAHGRWGAGVVIEVNCRENGLTLQHDRTTVRARLGRADEEVAHPLSAQAGKGEIDAATGREHTERRIGARPVQEIEMLAKNSAGAPCEK